MKRWIGQWASVCWLLCLSLTACTPDKPAFKSIDITGADYAQGFTLTDAQGQTRSLRDFKGKVMVVFFGYTQCPDVCPTTLQELLQVRRLLGQDGAKLQALFITVDPERDSPELWAMLERSIDDPASAELLMKMVEVGAKLGELLRRGYRVRTTLRSLAKEADLRTAIAERDDVDRETDDLALLVLHGGPLGVLAWRCAEDDVGPVARRTGTKTDAASEAHWGSLFFVVRLLKDVMFSLVAILPVRLVFSSYNLCNGSSIVHEMKQRNLCMQSS